MLFPKNSNPFYAGYGNRVNVSKFAINIICNYVIAVVLFAGLQDVYAYRAVDIPTSRIFTINHRGELKLEQTQSFQSS